MVTADELYQKMALRQPLLPDDLRNPDIFVQAARKLAEDRGVSLSAIDITIDDIQRLGETIPEEDVHAVFRAMAALATAAGEI